MGCVQSRIENEESVARCKERKNLIKEAVVARNAFAAAHCGFSMALKNSGAALSDYGHGETYIDLDLQNHMPPPPLDTGSNPPPPPLMEDNLLPPPPPPSFSLGTNLKRAATMPADMAMQHRRETDPAAIAEEDEEEEEEEDSLKVNGRSGGNVLLKKSSGGVGSPPGMKAVSPSPMPESKEAWDYFFMMNNMPEDENEEIEGEGEGEGDGDGVDDNNNCNNNNGVVIDEVEPKTPEKVKGNVNVELAHVEITPESHHIQHAKTAPAEFKRALKGVPNVTLLQILNRLDDQFLKSSESAQEVNKLLEATRLQYHSNFADNRGHVDHSARVMRVITWNRSFKGVSNGDGAKDDFDSEEYETHATILDKLLAWEKKLYEEVKQGELMKFEYQRKVAILNKQKKHGASAESLEKTKAVVSHLHTTYIVDMQSMDSTVSEVNQIRDAQLYPRLVVLVSEMANMWEDMSLNHDNQLKIVTELKSLDISQAPKETTKHHHERTVQLWNVVQEWSSQFDNLVSHQKQYIQALNSWLKLNLIPIESNPKEKISSPPKASNPPIQTLLLAWHDYIDKLPDELAKTAISSFAAVIKTIILQQEDEMKVKEKCEKTRKEYLRIKQSFEEWYHKYLLKSGPDEVDNERGGGEGNTTNNTLLEKQFSVESLKKRLDEEVESHQKLCVHVREKSLQSLKTRLPELFRALSDYTHACADAYGKLKSVTQSRAGAA